MTNLDNIIKSRDITFLTKVCLVKVVGFAVVIYGCESWTTKKAESEELMLLSCAVGEGNGTPLQYFCLENPMDRGAWWAAVHRVAKSWT